MKHRVTEATTKAKCGCDVFVSEDTVECQIFGCLNDDLCTGCSFECGTCNRIFCEDHTMDLADVDRTLTESIYQCVVCRARAARKAA